MEPSPLITEQTVICRDWQLPVTVDMILQRQGAPPEKIRRRQPRLVALAEKALAAGMPLVRPQVAYQILRVQQIEPPRVILNENAQLRGDWIARKLAGADFLVLAIATIGPDLEKLSLCFAKEDSAFALALDGCGSAAVGALTVAMRRFFAERARERQLTTTAPAYPGANDWELAPAQATLFSIVDASAIGVSLTSSFLMTPCKSVSLVMGVGHDLQPGKPPCEECGASGRCSHKTTEP